jgi:outer membrane protein assembly factor BamB
MSNDLILGTRGFVVSVDVETGEEHWRTKLESGGLFNAAAYSDVTVIIRDRLIVAGCNGHLFGLDRHNGQILWHNTLRGLGNNHISLATDGVSIQYLQRTVHTHSGS